MAHVVCEPDNGPADALNKGFRLATGDVVAWLNADDCYYPGTLRRVANFLEMNANAPFCFGHCPIVNEEGEEIRQGITRFKEMFFPVSSRFTYRAINYISQPALFFRRDTLVENSPLDTRMVAAWDYKFVLGLWAVGRGMYLEGKPLARFRWHENSISGRNFGIQFKEEFDAVKQEAGALHPAVLIHFFVRWLIVGAYQVMSLARKSSKEEL